MSENYLNVENLLDLQGFLNVDFYIKKTVQVKNFQVENYLGFLNVENCLGRKPSWQKTMQKTVLLDQIDKIRWVPFLRV